MCQIQTSSGFEVVVEHEKNLTVRPSYFPWWELILRPVQLLVSVSLTNKTWLILADAKSSYFLGPTVISNILMTISVENKKEELCNIGGVKYVQEIGSIIIYR